MSKPSKIKKGTQKQQDGLGQQKIDSNQLIFNMFQAQQEIVQRLHQHEIFIASIHELLIEGDVLKEEDFKQRIEKLTNELRENLEKRREEMEKKNNDKQSEEETNGMKKIELPDDVKVDSLGN